MREGISEIVGPADGVGKLSVTVYRALRPLLCAACSVPIAEGMFFTWRSRSGQELRLLPQCQECAPFVLRSAGEEERRLSPLLKSLLTPQPEPERGEARRRDHNAEREAIEQRLGPVLRRLRRRVKA